MLLNYQFNNPQLLQVALTHPSRKTPSNAGQQNYQRMEFLGDKVLGMIMAELIYARFQDMSEGDMSIMFANLVQTKILAHIANEQQLGTHLRMDPGEIRAGGAQNPKNLENALEAVIAAVYLDSNYQTIHQLVAALWEPYLQDVQAISRKDDKSTLQELAQKKYRVIPQYTVLHKQGADHDPHFTVQVTIEGAEPMTCNGAGKSIKAAEYEAAHCMLALLTPSSDS